MNTNSNSIQKRSPTSIDAYFQNVITILMHDVNKTYHDHDFSLWLFLVTGFDCLKNSFEDLLTGVSMVVCADT